MAGLGREGCCGCGDDMPEGCIANAIWFTTPRDACRLSTVSSVFKSAAESDAVWVRFLPEDYRSVIARSSDPSLLSRPSSKKELYFLLCDQPILVDDGLKSFSLDKCTGKKCYMLSARDLTVVWGDTPAYWTWVPDPKSRFDEVAELLSVCWLEIRGKIKTNMLSKQTHYTAYFVFQLSTRTHGFECHPVEASVGLAGCDAPKRLVHLDTEKFRSRRNPFMLIRRRRPFPRNRISALQVPVPDPAGEGDDGSSFLKERGDGLLEVEMGDFFNGEGDNGELEMSVLEVERGGWKGGLIVHGIEMRPKAGK